MAVQQLSAECTISLLCVLSNTAHTNLHEQRWNRYLNSPRIQNQSWMHWQSPNTLILANKSNRPAHWPNWAFYKCTTHAAAIQALQIMGIEMKCEHKEARKHAAMEFSIGAHTLKERKSYNTCQSWCEIQTQIYQTTWISVLPERSNNITGLPRF